MLLGCWGDKEKPASRGEWAVRPQRLLETSPSTRRMRTSLNTHSF